MPRPTDSPDVAASKTLSYILRHGAEKEGLHMRSDGFIKLTDVLGRPKMRDVDKDMVLRLVAENAKQRFELFYGLDPSPPVVKAKKGQGKGKGKGGPKPNPVLKGQSSADLESEKSAATGDAAETGDRKVQTVDAAQVDDLRKELSKATLQDPKPISTELPLISIPIPLFEGGDACSSGTTPGQAEGSTGEYFIRATQGHTIKVETAALLEEVKNDEEGRTKAGLLVHGTRWDLWDVLRESGLSRMARTHIHLAPALSDHRILPRPNSTLRIYLDLQKLLDAGIPVYTSSNGVVLTPGDERGVVEKQYWSKAERRINGEWHTVLENGKEVEGAEDLANGTAAANEAVGSPVNP